MTDRTDMDQLDALFAEIAEEPAPEMSETLSARIMGDALREMPTPLEPAPAPRSLWESIRAAVGGWPSLGGMAVAGVAGLWIGIMPPVMVQDITARMMGDSVSLTVLSDGALSLED
ncbi:MAG: hypothetical protein CSA72_06075 [Rhodobacterales bacterium]|nr:MAG: hypothetical protein CSA72_06075 [Rhodobacterales bacterium]